MAIPTLKTIEVEITPSGEVQIEAIGFKDGACLKETKELEEALGKVEKRHVKPEGVKVPAIADKTQIGGKG